MDTTSLTEGVFINGMSVNVGIPLTNFMGYDKLPLGERRTILTWKNSAARYESKEGSQSNFMMKKRSFTGGEKMGNIR